MMKTLLWSSITLLGVLTLALVLIGRQRGWELIAGPPDHGQYDFAAGRRSPTANDALACTEGLCTDPDFEISAMDGDPASVIERLSQRFAAIDPLARRVDDRRDPAKARFVTYSPMMRFPDVIHLEAVAMPDGRSGLMAYARAQLGKSDFGKNRARLEALLAAP